MNKHRVYFSLILVSGVLIATFIYNKWQDKNAFNNVNLIESERKISHQEIKNTESNSSSIVDKVKINDAEYKDTTEESVLKQAKPFSELSAQWSPENLAPYMEGTDIDGALNVDAFGNLIIDENVLYFIEYFYSTIGEATVEQIQTHLIGVITDLLPEPARAQGIKLVDNYIKYRRMEGELNTRLSQQQQDMIQQGPGGTKDYAVIENVLTERSILREEVLGKEVATAFWKNDEAYDFYTLKRFKIIDSNLSLAEKNRQLSELGNEAPEDYINANEKTEQLLLLKNIDMDTVQLSELSSIVGEPAAKRLKASARAKREFQGVYDIYFIKRSDITNSDISEDEKKVLVSKLRKSYFPNEYDYRKAELYDENPGMYRGD